MFDISDIDQLITIDRIIYFLLAIIIFAIISSFFSNNRG